MPKLALLPPLDPIFLRQALRATLAALAAFYLTSALGLPKGYWAALSAVLVVQSNIGASLAMARDRLLGTLLGAVAGVGCALIAGPSPALTVITLTIGLIVLVYAAAVRPALKLGPVTLVIVLLSDPTHAAPVLSGLERCGEITLGSLIGTLAAVIILPARAADHLRRDAAAALKATAGLIDLIGARLAGAAVSFDSANAMIRQQIRTVDTRLGEARRERAGRLSHHVDPAPVLRGLRRLWHSEILLARAADRPLPPVIAERLGPAVAEVIADGRRRMISLGAAVAAGERPAADDLGASVAGLGAQIEALRHDPAFEALSASDSAQVMALLFGSEQIAANLDELAARIGELARDG